MRSGVWWPSEEDTLRSGVRLLVPLPDIANQLRRELDDVEFKAMALGLGSLKGTPLTKDEQKKVTALRIEGVSNKEIGRRLGRSENSIAGFIRRSPLPARPSPIKRSA